MNATRGRANSIACAPKRLPLLRLRSRLAVSAHAALPSAKLAAPGLSRNFPRVRADDLSVSHEVRTELATRNRNANAKRPTGPQRKGDDIAERLLALAAAVLRLLPILSEQPAARSLVKQLERCGPAGGANYEEARGAESPSDFTHKVRIALKQVRETRYWLRLVLKAELLDCPHTLARLIDESGELIAILTASANPARRRTQQRTRS